MVNSSSTTPDLSAIELIGEQCYFQLGFEAIINTKVILKLFTPL